MASFLNRTTNKLISKQEYEVFCKEYIFDQLKGKRFGQAFCERFDIVNDMVVKLLIDEDIAREMIEENYIK
jgi:hypothetical protein